MQKADDVTIVSLRREHIARIAQLEQQCFSDPWSEGLITSELENPLARWYVLVDGDDVRAYVATMLIFDELHITNVVVSPSCRRSGYAKRLVTLALEQAKAHGAVSATLEVRQSNISARALYEKMGFEQVGIRPKYYHDPDESAVLMTLDMNKKEQL